MSGPPPGGVGSGGGGTNAPPTRENIRATMDQWRQRAIADRSYYEPRIRDQINRSFTEYSPPLYASAIGLRRAWNLRVAQSAVTGYAATLGRELSDDETTALTEHTLHNLHVNAAMKWALFGVAGYLTYRGRKTWQFPFYKPKLGGKFNPYEATSIIGGQKIRGFYPQILWHSLRFAAYGTVTMLFAEPVIKGMSFLWHEKAIAQDVRLKRFTRDANKRVEQVFRGQKPTLGQGAAPQQRQQREQDQQDQQDQSAEYTYDQTSMDEDYAQTFGPEAAAAASSSTPSWNTVSQNQQQQQQQPQRQQRQQPPAASDDKWSSPLDDDEDASPVASSSRSQPMSSSTGSAWDRVRRQTQYSSNSNKAQPQSQNSWAKVSQQAEAQSSWNTDNAGTNPEYRGARDSYSYSRADEDKATAKEQAQQEFDRLLEKERQGANQEQPWGRR